MLTVFYVAAGVAILATLLMLTRLNAVHALLYLIVSLLAVAVVFYVLGAPFIAALEVIIYAGAIMVLFVFVVMMLNLGRQAVQMERAWLRPRMWIGPVALALVLLVEVFYLLARAPEPPAGGRVVNPKEVGIALFGPYLIGVELASLLLMAGLVGAYHLGSRRPAGSERRYGPSADESGVAPRGDLVRAGADRDPRSA